MGMLALKKKDPTVDVSKKAFRKLIVTSRSSKLEVFWKVKYEDRYLICDKFLEIYLSSVHF